VKLVGSNSRAGTNSGPSDVAEHGVERDALHPAPDDDGQLPLVVEEPRAPRHADRAAMPVEGRRRLHEVRRLGRHSRRVLLDPRAVGEVDGEDLRRLDRCEVERIGLGELAAVVERDPVPVPAAPPGLAVDLDSHAACRGVKDGRHTPRPPTA
jgi:hypothetical protein